MKKAVFLFALAFNVLAQSAQAVEVTITLPRSQIPSRDDNPECGNTELEAQTASAILRGVTGALDSYIGMPVTSATTQMFGGAGDVLARLGLHNGKSACQAVCVVAPVNASFRTYMTPIPGRGEKGWTDPASAESPSAANGTWEWGRSVNSSAVRQGNAILFCTTAKNWSHDQDRSFTLRAE